MKLLINNIKKEFSKFGTFTTNDLFEFYKSKEPNVKKATVNWRIYQLVQQGVLQSIGRGKYIIGKEQKYLLELSSKENKISKLIDKEFPFINYCIWNTSCLNEFSQHLSSFHFIIVEIEKEAIESVYFTLKDTFNSTYKKPAKEIIEEFVFNKPNSIIISSFVSEAPIQKHLDIPTSTLEKLLVDLYCDKKLFYFLQGNELVSIYRNAFEKYTVNQSKLFRYANRRGKKQQIKEFIKPIFRQ